ncbi:CHAT domain-containing protein [Nocardioides sp. MH1]|uniref:CHAT domain-containing protein n=1 Tax=Nocardioides sp. MH1 TaxID=3242490 RepID=UPI0035204221
MLTWQRTASAGRDREYKLVNLHEIDAERLKNTLAWPQPRPAHGSGVVSQLLDDTALHDRPLTSSGLHLLSTQLAAPIARACAAEGIDQVTLIPLGVFADAPLSAAWALAASGLPTLPLPSGHGRTATATVDAVGVAPSARSVRNRTPGTAATRHSHLLTVSAHQTAAGPLPWAHAESTAIGRLFPGTATLLRGADATVAAVLSSIAHASHVHFAGHGAFAHADPMQTYLECVDGPLTLADLISAGALTETRLFIASACSVGAGDTFRTPDQALGLPTVLLDGHGCALVAPIRPVYDIAAAIFAIRAAELMWSTPTRTPAQAVWRAQSWLAHTQVGDLVAWGAAHPALHLAEAFAETDPRLSWLSRPDIWAPFTYFGR